MKKLLSYIVLPITLLASAIGAVLYFLRTTPKSPTLGDKMVELDKKAEALKASIKESTEARNKPVEDKNTKEEIEYWEKENKGKIQ